MERLKDDLHMETFANSSRLCEQMDDNQVQSLIGSHLDEQTAVCNQLQLGNKEACRWILQNTTFQSWLNMSPDTRWISMYGDMGVGKSVTTFHVAEHVRNKFGAGIAYVCSHFCRDNEETSSLEKIYLSVLSQLLQQVNDLKGNALKSLREHQTNGSTALKLPRSRDQLESQLQELIGSMKDPMYLIFDGLDECSSQCCTHLLSLLVELCANQTLLRVFISCRPNDDIQRKTSKYAKVVHVCTSKDRDRLIASDLVDRHMDGRLSSNTQEQLIGELAKKAQGSAIWMRLLVEYLASTHSITWGSLKRELQDSSPNRLSALYVKLFDKATNKESSNQQFLAHILEILAVSRRPLTLRELSFALAMNERVSTRFTSLAQLEGYLEEGRASMLARWFISRSQTTPTSQATMHLVHQSLKEIILRCSALNWAVECIAPRTPVSSREDTLNGKMLRTCVSYLLLEEVNRDELLPSNELNLDELAHFALLDEDNLSGDLPLEQVFTFDPGKRGLGGFFRYSACYWLSHLREAAAGQDVPSVRDLRTLFAPHSRRLRNWVEQYKRPSCSYEKYDFQVTQHDPISNVARFGSSAALAQVLQESRTDYELLESFKKGAWGTLESVLEAGNVTTARVLLSDPSTAVFLRDPAVFWTVSSHWNQHRQRTPFEAEPWNELFKWLTVEMVPELQQDPNETLCRVAKDGCLPLVQQIFAAARAKSSIWEQMLKAHTRDRGTMEAHQSVGESSGLGSQGSRGMAL